MFTYVTYSKRTLVICSPQTDSLCPNLSFRSHFFLSLPHAEFNSSVPLLSISPSSYESAPKYPPCLSRRSTARFFLAVSPGPKAWRMWSNKLIRNRSHVENSLRCSFSQIHPQNSSNQVYFNQFALFQLAICVHPPRK